MLIEPNTTRDPVRHRSPWGGRHALEAPYDETVSRQLPNPKECSMKSGCLRALMALLITMSCTAAWSAGWVAVLKNSPAEDFDDEDIQLFLANAKTALDATGTEPVAWVNPRTGSGGTLTVTGQPKAKSGAECKRVRMQLYSKKQQGYASTLTACRDEQSHWRLAKIG
jgi:hypothetical protein